MDILFQNETEGIRINVRITTSDVQSHSRVSDYKIAHPNRYVSLIDGIKDRISDLIIDISENTTPKQ